LLIPGAVHVGEGDLSKFKVSLDEMGEKIPVSLKNKNILYRWDTKRSNARIEKTEVVYESPNRNTSKLIWNYSGFKSLGSKMFPLSQEFSFTTHANGKEKNATVRIEMDDIRTTSDWDTETTISPKYKQVDAKDIFDKLLNM